MHCDIKFTCARFMAKQNTREQAYLFPRKDKDGKCLDEWKLNNIQLEKINGTETR